MNVLHTVTRDERFFLITVTGDKSETEEIRARFLLELEKETRPFTLKLPRTEVEFVGRGDIGVRLPMVQVRCIGYYTDVADQLTASEERATVTPSQ